MKTLTQEESKEFTYTYVLSTEQQKQTLDLTKYKQKLSKVIKEFFGKKLMKVTVAKDHYILILVGVFTVGEKRKLGKEIATKVNLKQYVNTINYNGGQDKIIQYIGINRV